MLKLCKGLSLGKPISIGGFNVSPSKNPLKLNIPLTGSITPLKGTRAIPTYTRDTTATVIDFEGVIHTALINEIRFPGCRRVKNLLAASEDLNNASWLKLSSASVSVNQTEDIIGNLTADLIDISADSSSRVAQVISSALIGTYRLSIYLKSLSGSGTYSLYLNSTGAESTKICNLTEDWQRFELSLTTISVSNLNCYIGYNGLTGTLDKVYCCFCMLEMLSGTQTEASEYVSNGVLSWPYHGCGVDGVKYFNTDREGNILELKGALVEPTATNLITHSSALSNWSTSSGGCTVVPSAIITPIGIYSDKISQVDSITDGIYKTLTLSTSTKYCISFLICNVDSVRSRLNLWNITTSKSQADLQIAWTDGIPSTYSSSGITDIEYIDNGDGFYLVRLCITTGSSGSNYPFTFYPEYSITAVHSVYLTRVQTETNKHTSYIPTSGSILTRTSDNLSYDVSGDITQAEGSLYCEVSSEFLGTSDQYVFDLHDGSANNRIFVLGNSGSVQLYVFTNGSQVVAFSHAVGEVRKILVTYKNNEVKLYINGSILNTDNSVSTPTLTTLNNGSSYLNSNHLNDAIKSIKYFSEVIPLITAIRMTT